ncbi:MAG: hypothetical protein JOZ51_08510 [Chloroflexi bacterium]|nr:hypothetical protein [Chloroflexota bacterium]
MPIDFASIAEQFRAPIGAQMQTISRAFERLGRWLATRRKAFEELERNSRSFPVIRFYNEAVTLTVTERQRGALAPGAEPPTLAAGLRAGGADFVRGIGRIGTAIREDLILPRFFGMLRAITTMILESVERFNPPTAAMFDINARRGSDLFGEAGLLVGAIGQSRIQIKRFVGWVSMARTRWQAAFPSATPASSATATPAPAAGGEFDAAALLGTFDTVVQGISGALLLLPILPRTLAIIAQAAILRIKFKVVTMLQGAEARLFQLRRSVIDLFSVQLLGFLGTAQSFLIAIAILMLSNVGFYLRFGIAYGREFIGQLRRFLGRFSGFINHWQSVIVRIFETIDKILDFNLTPLILSFLGVVGWVINKVGDPPAFTIRDLLGVGATAARLAGRIAMEKWLGRVLGTLSIASRVPWLGKYARAVRRRVSALRDLLRVALRPMADFPMFTRPPGYSGANFPNIYNAFFGGPVAADLRRRLGEFETSAIDGVGSILGAGTDLLRGLGTSFDRSADEFARLGSPRRYQRLVADANQLADTALGDQVAALSERGAQASANPVAATFERWLIDSGFELMGAAIPLYINEMRHYWHAIVAEETSAAAGTPPPTSPHILARRVRIGAVRVPSMTIRATGRDLDDTLAATIAARFRTAVAESYRSGERVLGVETP